MLPQLLFDYNDATRPVPPSIGAIEPNAISVTLPTPTPTPTPAPTPTKLTTITNVSRLLLSQDQGLLVVIVTAPAGGIASGNLTVSVNGATVGPYTLNGKGAFTLSLSSAILQSTPMTVNYLGDSVYAASTGTLNQ